MGSFLTPDLLISAYMRGAFPMAEDAGSRRVFWVEPEQRGILPLDRLHVPRRLRRTLRATDFEIRCNRDFIGVIRACAEARPERPRTWINDEILEAFVALHRMGAAHSVETWRDGALVGGLYGLALNGAFFGESMFSRATDASKIALIHLIARLRRDGFALLDTQLITDHLKQFGAIEIPRAAYRRHLAKALRVPARFQPELPVDAAAFLQSITQTS